MYRSGCGGGRSGIESRWNVSGCDVSPTAIEHARRYAAENGAEVNFFQRDVLAEPLPEGFDVITCSLFLHHLDEGQALTLLRRMRESAGTLALVNDLDRCTAGWWAAYLGSRILTRSPVVHVDALLSVEGAFTPNEALDLARRAGWEGPACDGSSHSAIYCRGGGRECGRHARTDIGRSADVGRDRRRRRAGWIDGRA